MALRRRGVDAAAVIAVWAVMLLVESLVVTILWGREFSAAWEIVLTRRLVVPLALLGLAPLSPVVVGWWRVACLAHARARLSVVALALLGATAGGALAVGLSGGRHFAALGLRAAFVAVLAAVGAGVGAWVVPRVAGLAARAGGLAILGLTILVAAWLADAFVLPRLYPAFHVAMLAACLLGGACVAMALRALPEARWTPRVASLVVAAVVVACAARAPSAARELERFANLRIILVEHAPLLGRAVEVTEALRPPRGDAATPSNDAATTPGEIARSLDWTGHDLVLVTIDALRADHVSAYGYPRPTTPSLDALAREGTLFESAYCPTPHTSYSVTSMMTGKYLRPLLALGLGGDSETWAQDLRRYGWRTAAFYPPAVFFIDEDRFTRFEEAHLGFEYAKVEFADPALRERQVAEYLDGVTGKAPLFLWVHFFEPHEPYVLHADHVFQGGRSADEDAYDGEVATADEGVGRVVRLVRARRPGAVIMVTADHGEEFGEHGGRYHGTTVYEEQVRVPLVVAGPGVRAGARAATVVQTIDLLPTALSALGIPRPARLRGRDLGPALAGSGTASTDPGLAFAETDDYALVASGPDRLVCARRASACALYRPAGDPGERRDVAAADPARFEQLRGMLRAIERDHGRYEGGAAAWPEALRRGMQGDAEAAIDVASLLDDADVTIRRKAAEVSYRLHAASTVPQLRRALAREEDDEARRWSVLALARTSGDPAPPLAEAMLREPTGPWRRRAALALGERGDARACDELASWWAEAAPVAGKGGEDGEPPRLPLDLPAVQELLGATARARCRSAVPALVRALEDVRARPYVADALGSLGDDRARAPLLGWLSAEPYVTTRPHEARALLALKKPQDWASKEPVAEVRTTVEAGPGPVRLIALLSDPGATLDGEIDGTPLTSPRVDGEVRSLRGVHPTGAPARVTVRASVGGVLGLWLAPAGGGATPDLIEKPGWRK